MKKNRWGLNKTDKQDLLLGAANAADMVSSIVNFLPPAIRGRVTSQFLGWAVDILGSCGYLEFIRMHRAEHRFYKTISEKFKNPEHIFQILKNLRMIFIFALSVPYFIVYGFLLILKSMGISQETTRFIDKLIQTLCLEMVGLVLSVVVSFLGLGYNIYASCVQGRFRYKMNRILQSSLPKEEKQRALLQFFYKKLFISEYKKEKIYAKIRRQKPQKAEEKDSEYEARLQKLAYKEMMRVLHRNIINFQFKAGNDTVFEIRDLVCLLLKGEEDRLQAFELLQKLKAKKLQGVQEKIRELEKEPEGRIQQICKAFKKAIGTGKRLKQKEVRLQVKIQKLQKVADSSRPEDKTALVARCIFKKVDNNNFDNLFSSIAYAQLFLLLLVNKLLAIAFNNPLVWKIFGLLSSIEFTLLDNSNTFSWISKKARNLISDRQKVYQELGWNVQPA